MTLLILGLALWVLAHFWKRLAPAHRAKFGEKGKMYVAIGAGAGLILMIIGYRMAEGAYYWGRTPALTGINNLLMLLSFYLFAASGSKARITQYIRHPQLTAVMVWALAHMLVNGDAASIILFGGMLVWASSEIQLINRAQPDWTPGPTVPMKKEITALIATVIVFAVVAGVHMALGYNPFG
ncbi:NnrU protein [Yoonia tamlensis]|uniref:NnrU protein n=1 Tax=Yoonia tamlensis TaxID=390270 RepID=A0A1I6GXM9_9RHOB|nr:NnrU family protein [Yoonia tamlensis]SFR46952.1 NnrU protein [Yoonia tamlensis]